MTAEGAESSERARELPATVDTAKRLDHSRGQLLRNLKGMCPSLLEVAKGVPLGEAQPADGSVPPAALDRNGRPQDAALVFDVPDGGR